MTDESSPVCPQTNATSCFLTTLFFFGASPSAPSTCIASSFSSISSVYACSNDSTPFAFSRVLTFTTW